MLKKEWKDIYGYEGLYQISNYGEVKSIRSNKILKLEVLKKGYLRVGLSYNNKKERFLVHRLVLNAFIGYKSYPEYEGNHKDMNTQNNKISNLEWTTPQENLNHAMDNNPQRIISFKINGKKMGIKYSHLGIEASKKPVAKIDIQTGNIIKIYESAREASRDGYNYKNISQVCNKKRHTHKGFIWKFVNK
jgi:hypothetical protein